MIEGLALQKDEIELLDDKTLPPSDVMDEKLKDVGPEFIAAVYSDGYNPNVGTSKRKAPTAAREPAKKVSKTDVSSFDMGSHVREKSVAKLTVAQLKDYLQSVDVKVAGMKKAQLVDAVYEYFN